MVGLLSALLCTAPLAVQAFEKWVAEKRLEVTGAEGKPFRQPSDLTVSEGKIYLLDSLNNRLCGFDAAGRSLECIYGKAETSLYGSMGITADGRGKLYLADGRRGRILLVGNKGDLSVFATVAKEKDEGDPDPAALACSGEQIYVSDKRNHVLRIFSPDGKQQEKWGGAGDGLGQFKNPFRVLVDPVGRIVVLDVLNSRLQLFTPKGEYLGSVGGPGVVSGTLFRPAGLEVDGQGRYYVADAFFGTVQVFDSSGNLVALLCDRLGAPLTLNGPVALKFFRDELYVVEMGANRFSVYALKH